MAAIKTKKGFTIVELLIATTIFTVFLTSVVTVIIDLYRASRRISLEEQIYSDVRVMVKQITNMFEQNTIDYEEYYRVAMGGEFYTKHSDPNVYSYGDYGKVFYDMGTGGPGPNGEGVWCNDGTDPEFNPGCVIDKSTIDTNRGKHPVIGNPALANAFCGAETLAGVCPVDLTPFFKQTQLYLINKNGDRKTIIGLEPYIKDVDSVPHDEKAVSAIWFNGIDLDADDVSDEWILSPEINNVGGDAGLINDLNVSKDFSSVYDNFIPISPLRTNIVNLVFYVMPLEDPYKAFAETDPATGTLVQPHVTIVMTVEPSASELTDYLGPVPRQTIQTTIYSRVQGEVRSY
ncbi:type II secretion system protein [Candidatus Peregrinibacteria bacterium]|nr:type II secretion system protein [Candidatus Peregrinibacteria bacterium]